MENPPNHAPKSNMTRRAFLATLSAVAAASPNSPNIVLLLADDLGYGELGCQGNPQIPTPHIDSIAQSGVRFTNGYVSAPYCCPSRAGLITGRYQTRFGHELNATGKLNLAPHVGLPLTETTLASRLQSAGYRTAAIGKWHLGATEKFHPLNRGFHEFFGFLHEGHYYAPQPAVANHLRPNEPPYDDANPLLRNRQPVDEPEYFTRALAREAVAFIDRNRKKPFFLYVPFNAVHSPMQATHQDMDRFAHITDPHRRIFAAMLASLDDAVGAILKKLQSENLTKNPLVIFLSDNGGPVAELTSSNAPLRGQKGQLYEGGIRIPFLMQWPGHLPAARTHHAPVISLDLAPTILAAAKINIPKNLDGQNLLPLPTQPRPLFWRYNKSQALRLGDWKIVRQQGPREPDKPWQLFNLTQDIRESNDLAPADPAKLKELATLWETMNAQMVPPLW